MNVHLWDKKGGIRPIKVMSRSETLQLWLLGTHRLVVVGVRLIRTPLPVRAKARETSFRQ